VSEYAPTGKSDDEIRGLWRWIEAKLYPAAVADDAEVLIHYPAAPDIAPAIYVPVVAETAELVSMV
jgi:hypothetical protein